MKIVSGQTIVSLEYPDSATGKLTLRKGKVEKVTETSITVFTNKGYRTFDENKMCNLKIIGGND
jgi:hypothetical protein